MTIIDRLKKYAGLNKDTDRCQLGRCVTVREYIKISDDIERNLETIVKRLNFVEDRYEELHDAASRCLQYNEVDLVRFNEAMKAMDALIQRHIAEIGEMESGE